MLKENLKEVLYIFILTLLVDLMNSKKASDILTIFKEKADKIDQIDRFNQFMSGKNGIKH